MAGSPVPDARTIYWEQRAAQLRALAGTVRDPATARAMRRLAQDIDAFVAGLEGRDRPGP